MMYTVIMKMPLNPMLIDALMLSNHYEGERSNEALLDSMKAWESLAKSGLTVGGLALSHAAMMKTRPNIADSQKGILRVEQSFVQTAFTDIKSFRKWTLPPAELVPGLMARIIEEVDRTESYAFANRFIRIHPYTDGNGRMARIAMNHLNKLRGENVERMQGGFAHDAQRDFNNWLNCNVPCVDFEGQAINSINEADVDWEAVVFSD
jgi:Fic/DOC family